MLKFLLALLFFSVLSPMPANAYTGAEKKALTLIYSWQTEDARSHIEQENIDRPEIKGLLEFYSGNYNRALSYFRQARNMPHELENIKNIIEEAYPLLSEFKEIATKRFLIRYTGSDKILALHLKEILENAADKMASRFKWELKEKAIIEIYPDRESFMLSSTLTEQHIKVSGAVGICKFNRMMIISPRVLHFGYMWPDTAIHELAHLYVGRISQNAGVPLWLNEGIATNLEEIWRKDKSPMKPSQLNSLAQAARKEEWVELEKMRHGMPTLESREEVSLAFAQVKSMTKNLFEKYGWETIAQYLHKKALAPQNTFEKVFNISQHEFKLYWQNELKKSEITTVEGAANPLYVFADEPVNIISEWVSRTARTDLRVADRFRERGRYDLAVKKYQDALDKDPGNSVILNRKGRSYADLNKKTEALNSFKLAIKHNPSYPPPYLHSAEIHLSLNEFALAKEMLLEYVYRMPFNPRAHNMLSRAAAESSDKKIAELEERTIQILNEY
ncbi:MAG: peptidase MA family metallohydrolase [Elusimicrobiota bacterium]